MKVIEIGDITVAVEPLAQAPMCRLSLSVNQLADVKSLKLEKRQQERLVAYFLINEVVGRNALLHHYPNGSPFLVDNDGKQIDCHFSLSHSKSTVVIAHSPSQRVGVDIEDANDRMDTLKHKFLTDDEMLRITDPQLLLAAWTVNEAAYKLAQIDGLPLRGGVMIDSWEDYRKIYGAVEWNVTVNDDQMVKAVTHFFPKGERAMSVAFFSKEENEPHDYVGPMSFLDTIC